MPVTSPTYELSDEQYAQVADLLPGNGGRGGQWNDHRPLLDGILHALANGGRWRSMPERFGPWQTVYDRFRKWTREGLWDRILDRLRARKEADGQIDFELFAVDGSSVRAHQSAAGARKKKGRRPGRRARRWAAAAAAGAPSCT